MHFLIQKQLKSYVCVLHQSRIEFEGRDFYMVPLTAIFLFEGSIQCLFVAKPSLCHHHHH